MNLALEFATIEWRPDGDRDALWIANGPVGLELDLWADVSTATRPRPLCELLLRELTRLLAGPDPELPFVPRVEETDSPWQVGLRLSRIDQVQGLPPSARQHAGPGEPVVAGDPAYRIVLSGGGDTATLRSDRAGVEALAAACREAAKRRRTVG